MCELSHLAKMWRDLKCMSLSKKSRSEKTTHCVSPIKRHSGKGKTVETGRSVVGCQGWEVGCEQAETEDF